MKPLKPTETHEVAGGKFTEPMIDGPTFPPYQIDPPPEAEPLPAELHPDSTVR